MWILVIVIIIVFVWLWFKYRKPKRQPIVLYSGRNGGGKSFSMSCDSLRDYRRSVRKWKRVNKPFLLKPLYLIPYFEKKRKNKEYYGLEQPHLYSTYPIKIGTNKGKPILSEPLTLEIMLLQKSIPLGSICVADEFSAWINQFEFNEAFSDALNDHIQKWRHYHGNDSHLFIADQCTNNIPIQVRYRCNSAICCFETKHYLKFIHITKYKNIDLTDAIKSVEIIDNDEADTDDKTLKMIRFQIKRIYDDRAYSNRYNFVDGNPLNSKFIDSPLKVIECMKKPDKKGKYPTIDDKINISK